LGQSYAHPLLILIIQSGGKPTSRFAVTAGRSVGNAVKRNRAKRLLRAALRELIEDIKPGYDGVLVARKPLAASSSRETVTALNSLLKKAGLFDRKTNGKPTHFGS